MSQENTKLCDFSNTNNNYFNSTLIAPATSVESYEINAALLNLVMKEQFSGSPNEDVASHLNTFVELCDMQKKKDVDNDIVKLKLIPFSLRDRAKTSFSHYCRMLLTRHYDQRPFHETVCDAIIANGGVKNRQKGAKHLRWRMHQTRFRF